MWDPLVIGPYQGLSLWGVQRWLLGRLKLEERAPSTGKPRATHFPSIFPPSPAAFFVGMLNSLVHVFMYLYYGLASLGPRLRPSLWWKRHLTILQLVRKTAGSRAGGAPASVLHCTSDLQSDHEKVLLVASLASQLAPSRQPSRQILALTLIS